MIAGGNHTIISCAPARKDKKFFLVRKDKCFLLARKDGASRLPSELPPRSTDRVRNALAAGPCPLGGIYLKTLERPVDLPENTKHEDLKEQEIPAAMEALVLPAADAEPKDEAPAQAAPEGAGEEQDAAPAGTATEEASPEGDAPAEALLPAEDGAENEPEDVPLPEEDLEAGPELEEMIARAKRRFRIRAEWVMVGIAFLAAIVLGVTAALSRPYYQKDEDPMDLPSYHMDAAEPQPTYLEPTVPETEPENPTIPPDPNPYDRFDFQYDRHNYLLLQNVASYPGVDVSAFQGNVDWKRVAASGIRFAIVRLGYRGYGSGKLVEDEYAQRNLDGAAEAGLQVGAYFFSQALNVDEVDEEIEFMLNVLGERYLDMPIILDWEIPTADARTAGKMDARSLTDLQLHFCREMTDRGYQPMVYFNWHQSEELYLLSEMEEYPFWLALYQDRMTYPWKVEMWQYSCTGRVPGIDGDVDLNVYMP